ncbi:IlvD/Edd family dehydratase [Streptomyces sp. NPDC020801]|uniref:IlvD/Edd family dehydratase n=1 Tax=unclassified Streptomyces TaxID=2593676 RepID=UPI0037BD98E1
MTDNAAPKPPARTAQGHQPVDSEAHRVPLRSRSWFGDGGKNGFIARHHLRAMGRGSHNFDGRPVIGICNSFSELTPCNGHLRLIAEAVKRGVLQAGGFPLEFPSMSLGEPLLRPTSMLYRNLAAMEIEEQIRANPLDAVVLLTGCDKTTPAALMGAASAGVPAIVLTGGPMLNGRFRGQAVGSGTDIWRMTEELRAGTITKEEFSEFESALNRSAGHCMTMGTASTMACLAEALGMMLPGASGLPAVDARRATLAEETGMRAVALAASALTPQRVMTRAAFENAVRVNAAIGGSTNAVLHLLALAGRLGVALSLDDFDRLGAELPLLVDLMPSGRFLMEEFAYAGGLPALIHQIRDHLDDSAITVTGHGLLENCVGAQIHDPQVIRPLDNPVLPRDRGTAVLRGNLAPSGAVIKQSAADPRLLSHTGAALVFDSVEDYFAVVEDPALDVTADTVLIVRNAGPRGYPGMPEIGNLPMPKKLLDAEVRDMVRISDARMSGTAFGTCVLHVAPEAAVGGPLALVRTGDLIRLDVPGRRLEILIDDGELARRRREWTPPQAPVSRGWMHLYTEHVTQADTGADLDFLVGSTSAAPPRQAF